jgi:hypothetical protein
MPTIRRPTDRDRRRQITPAAVEAFRAGDQLALHRLLGLKLWEPSPLAADSAGAGWPSVDDKRWAEIRELRFQLKVSTHAD